MDLAADLSMVRGVPTNAVSLKMPTVPASKTLSVLSLHVELIEPDADYLVPPPAVPAVAIRVNGVDPFAAVAPSWRGFSPEAVLGTGSPLLPSDFGRRVAVYSCSCGIPGCGVIAPVIVPSPDGRRVSWIDFRNYTGVFDEPTSDLVEHHDGSPWDIPDLHFDRELYCTEIARASEDTSWETPQRRTTRLLRTMIEAMDLTPPPGLTLWWVAETTSAPGVELCFGPAQPWASTPPPPTMLRLVSPYTDPHEAARDMAAQLHAMPPGKWLQAFGDRRDGPV